MAFVQVWFNYTLISEVELQPDVTTIGRGPECDIYIENAGISELHARIRRYGQNFRLEDAKSRNGLFVNGQRVNNQNLEFGDEITILKHKLKFVESASGLNLSTSVSQASDRESQNETVEVDVSNLGEMLRQRQMKSITRLLLTDARGMRPDYQIKSVSFRIGKSRDCDLYTPGWFAPRLAAKIVRRTGGYFLEPQKRGLARVNGKPIANAIKLNDGDRLSVRRMAMVFYDRAEVRPGAQSL